MLISNLHTRIHTKRQMTVPSPPPQDKQVAEAAPPSQSHPPLPEDVTCAQLLSYVQSSLYSHEVVWHVLNDHHPEWLSSMPPGGEETPLHALVRTGNVRLLEMMLAEVKEGGGEGGGEEETTTTANVASSSSSSSGSSGSSTTTTTTITQQVEKKRQMINIDLNALDSAGVMVREIIDEKGFEVKFPEIAKRIKELIAFQEAHDLAVALKERRRGKGGEKGGKEGEKEQEEQEEGPQQLAARLLYALSHNLSFISSSHHKAWSVLHHLVAAAPGGDGGREEEEEDQEHDNVILNLLKQIINLPCACPGGKIRLGARTRDCGKSVWEIALAEEGEGGGRGGREEMKTFVRETLGPMCGVHLYPSSSPSLLRLKEGGSGDEATHPYFSSSSYHHHHHPSLTFPSSPSTPLDKHKIKTIFFIRHAEGTHNQAAREEGEGAYKSWEWEDAELTAIGIEQARGGLRRTMRGREGGEEQSEEEAEGGREKGVELVVVSPLRRTLHTAMLAFWDEEEKEEEDGGNSNGNGSENSSSSSSSGRSGMKSKMPPLLAMEAVRETAGMDPCNKRSNVSYLAERFPHVDFSEIQSETDVLFEPREWESEESMAARGHYFLNWIGKRKERRIAVVTHGSFLMTMFERVLQAPKEMREWMGNAECRPVTIYFP